MNDLHETTPETAALRERISHLSAADPQPARAALSREFCRRGSMRGTRRTPFSTA